MVTKADIRNQIRAEKRSLTKEQISVAGKEVSRRLATFEPYLNTEAVYCYASYNQELPTKDIIQKALRDGKKVALPKVEVDDIRFYFITDLSQIMPGYQGIPEPLGLEPAIPSKEVSSLMLLPGLAFTRYGNRLGYGGGFYDRYLALEGSNAFHTCGLGYDFQVLQELPVEAFDIPLEYLITPSDIIQCENIRKELYL